MAGYVMLCKFTPKAVAEMKDRPEGIKKAKALAEELGVRTVGVWVTTGQYDVIALLDAPDEQAMGAFILRQTMRGYVTTETLRAFSEEEFAQIVSKLP